MDKKLLSSTERHLDPATWRYLTDLWYITWTRGKYWLLNTTQRYPDVTLGEGRIESVIRETSDIGGTTMIIDPLVLVARKLLLFACHGHQLQPYEPHQDSSRPVAHRRSETCISFAVLNPSKCVPVTHQYLVPRQSFLPWQSER
jgi:hypothetical protein